jgi:hypothetical protein
MHELTSASRPQHSEERTGCFRPFEAIQYVSLSARDVALKGAYPLNDHVRQCTYCMILTSVAPHHEPDRLRSTGHDGDAELQIWMAVVFQPF